MTNPLPPSVSRSVQLVGNLVLARQVEDSLFLQYARSCCSAPYSAVLLSGGTEQIKTESRYSMAAWDPMLVFQSKGSYCTIQNNQDTHTIQGCPLAVIDKIFASLQADFPLLVQPFSGGALGYFAYDLKNTIERLPQTVHDDLDLPDVCLIWPRQILVHDRLTKHLHYLSLGSDQPGEASAEKPGSLMKPRPTNDGDLCHPSGIRQYGKIRVGPLQSNFRHEDYLDAVRKVRHYIREGDVYQVNLSQRYRFSFEGDPFDLWSSLYRMNPAPFYAYINAGDHQVLSTSMERFLFKRGAYIETRPIKGTRKRGANSKEDAALIRELLHDPKDDAELSMIVDLLRNDLGRVCSPRSIRVAEHKRLESYQNVHHLISILTGELRSEASYGDILRATFPGGSITGCPKIRSMEIIDELEPNVRHVYTGAIGYLGFHENMDLNIAIRTALVHKGESYFSVGGGIVYDSREEDEYQETLHKGRTLFQLIEKIGATEA